VWSSGRKGPPGRLSRQGPPVLRRAVSEAGKTHGRAAAPDHGYYAQVKDRKNGKRAALPEAARSSGRPATSWPSPATTPPPSPDSPTSHGGHAEARRTRAGTPAATLTRWGNHRGQLRQAACQPPLALRKPRRTAQ
jgi:hypothetical protein